jgi:hypothetical protein
MIEKIVQTAKHIVKEMVESQSARPWCAVLECLVTMRIPQKSASGERDDQIGEDQFVLDQMERRQTRIIRIVAVQFDR